MLAPLPFYVVLNPSVDWHTRLYIAVLSIFFLSRISSVAIWRWQGFNSEHEHLTSTVWSSWSWTMGVTRGDLVQGSNYSSCIASEYSISNGVAVDFFLNCWKNRKTAAHAKWFPTLVPVTWTVDGYSRLHYGHTSKLHNCVYNEPSTFWSCKNLWEQVRKNCSGTLQICSDLSVRKTWTLMMACLNQPPIAELASGQCQVPISNLLHTDTAIAAAGCYLCPFVWPFHKSSSNCVLSVTLTSLSIYTTLTANLWSNQLMSVCT